MSPRLSRLRCWLRGGCRSPWTYVGVAGVATVQAFTGAVGDVAVWTLAHAGGLFTLLWSARRVGWLPPGASPLFAAAFVVLLAGYAYRWLRGRSS